ncbi:helix-turn-helix domain-containing protein [Bartonella sp. DGB2]|uniref:helix-turn-helix domain-containing protein n=1 Tax=Bartonella sp. DGB2 TaxID=3388426 RepID=UPI003990262D
MSRYQAINGKTMCECILDVLQSGKSISNVEAQALFRCRALPKRISELRVLGYPIKAYWREDITGQRYKRYQLEQVKANV